LSELIEELQRIADQGHGDQIMTNIFFIGEVEIPGFSSPKRIRLSDQRR